jgi:hypothetical protein
MSVGPEMKKNTAHSLVNQVVHSAITLCFLITMFDLYSAITLCFFITMFDLYSAITLCFLITMFDLYSAITLCFLACRVGLDDSLSRVS